MEATVAGSVVLDLATKADVDEHHDRIRKLLERPAVHFQRLAGAQASRAAPVLVNLGRPPIGQIWLPQWVTFLGNDAFGAAIANVTAALFAGGPPGSAGLATGPPVVGPDYANCLLAAVAVPSTQLIPEKSPVFTNEDLYAVFAGSGLVAGAANYRVTVGVLELPATDEALTWV